MLAADAEPDGVRLGAWPPIVLGLPAQSGHRLRSGLGDAFGQGMHRIAFHHAGHHQHVVPVELGRRAGQHLDAHHLRLLDGERTGLVEEHLRDTAEILQHILRLDQHAGRGETTRAGDVRHRRGYEQRAGRGEHEHLGESCGQAGHRPRHTGDHQGKHGEGHGQTVGGFHHGRTRLLRGRHEFEDALILRIGGHLCGAHGQRR